MGYCLIGNGLVNPSACRSVATVDTAHQNCTENARVVSTLGSKTRRAPVCSDIQAVGDNAERGRLRAGTSPHSTPTGERFCGMGKETEILQLIRLKRNK